VEKAAKDRHARIGMALAASPGATAAVRVNGPAAGIGRIVLRESPEKRR